MEIENLNKWLFQKIDQLNDTIRCSELDLGRVVVKLDRPNGPSHGSDREQQLKQKALYIAELSSAHDQIELLKELKKEFKECLRT